MEIIRSQITEVEKVVGVSHQNVEPDQLRSLVKMAYEVDEDDIDNMPDNDLYAKYGKDFQERVTETEMVPGKRMYIAPGMGNIEQNLNDIRRFCRMEHIQPQVLESKPITTAEHFGEAIILEAEDEVIEKIKGYIEEKNLF